jgi:hypothetical protein
MKQSPGTKQERKEKGSKKGNKKKGRNTDRQVLTEGIKKKRKQDK